MSETLETPLVSIIMSVRNCGSTIRDALDSIRNQTYKNWELIVCDDASTDNTLDVLERVLKDFDPSQYKLLTNQVNQRLAASLNRCLEHVSGEYIARMDGDDISELDRLERQVAYLAENPEISLVGTAMRRFNSDGLGDVVPPFTLEPDRWTLGQSSKTPFAHATIMARREVFNIVGNYTVSPRTARAEDLDLWYKFFAAELRGRNMADILYLVREDAAAIRRRTRKSRLDAVIIRLQGNRKLGYPPRFYLPALSEFLKIFIPFFFFDLHRAWSRNQKVRGTVEPATTSPL